MISSWWWAALGAAGLGSVVLGAVGQVLRAETGAVARAAADVDRARSVVAKG